MQPAHLDLPPAQHHLSPHTVTQRVRRVPLAGSRHAPTPAWDDPDFDSLTAMSDDESVTTMT